MDNIQKLREARTLNDAKLILDKLHATGAVRKLVETSFMTRNSPDFNTREFGMGCLNEAATTLKDSEQPSIPESPGLKPKGKHFVQEEELSNHNTGARTTGSDQSTDNTPPYPQEGTKQGDEDMEHAPNTEDQMKEMENPNESPLNILENTGLHPDIAKKMGDNMPKIPPMDSGDQVKQMQYTMKKYHETVVLPLIKNSKIQASAIKELSKQIRETKGKSLEFALDQPTSFRETTISQQMQDPNQQGILAPNKAFELNEKRIRMIQQNEIMNELHR